jgi:DNA adenine methylase
VKPPLTYYGGKTLLAPRIAGMLPEHRHYVEPFGGSLAVLLAKEPAPHETVSDRDGDLITFWRVLRERPSDLERYCTLTPHARLEHQHTYGPVSGDHPDAELEQARRVWVKLTQGRAATMLPTGWRHYVRPVGATGMPRYLAGYLGRMAPVAQRLRQVSLECRPALDLIASFGRHRDVLLYVDPPYAATTGRATGYRHEMTGDDEHRQLAEALNACRSTVVLSGYRSGLYDDLYAGWHRHEIDTFTGQGGKRAERTEVLWSNRPLVGTFVTRPRFEATCNERRCQAPGCGLPVLLRSGGRPRKYCSTACRVAAHRARTANTQSAAKEER